MTAKCLKKIRQNQKYCVFLIVELLDRHGTEHYIKFVEIIIFLFDYLMRIIEFNQTFLGLFPIIQLTYLVDTYGFYHLQSNLKAITIESHSNDD